MFKASITSQKLVECIDALKALVAEAEFSMKPEGIYVAAVDASNVAMVTLDLASKAFESYEATEMVLGIDLKKMDGILEMSVKDEIVGLEVDEVSHKFIIKMKGLAYTMSLLDPASIRKLSKIPKLDLPGSVRFRGEDLRRGIKATKKVGDFVYIGISGKGFFIEGIGDTDSVKLELTRDEVIEMRYADVKAMFSLDYLLDISKVSSKAAEITLELGTDFPLRIKHKVADGNGDMMYILAPRVESS